MYSGISLDSFLKFITFQDISDSGLQLLGPTIQKLAQTENLTAHALAVEVRLKQINQK